MGPSSLFVFLAALRFPVHVCHETPTREQSWQNFDRGLRRGITSCIPTKLTPSGSRAGCTTKLTHRKQNSGSHVHISVPFTHKLALQTMSCRPTKACSHWTRAVQVDPWSAPREALFQLVGLQLARRASVWYDVFRGNNAIISILFFFFFPSLLSSLFSSLSSLSLSLSLCLCFCFCHSATVGRAFTWCVQHSLLPASLNLDKRTRTLECTSKKFFVSSPSTFFLCKLNLVHVPWINITSPPHGSVSTLDASVPTPCVEALRVRSANIVLPHACCFCCHHAKFRHSGAPEIGLPAENHAKYPASLCVVRWYIATDSEKVCSGSSDMKGALMCREVPPMSAHESFKNKCLGDKDSRRNHERTEAKLDRGRRHVTEKTSEEKGKNKQHSVSI